MRRQRGAGGAEDSYDPFGVDFASAPGAPPNSAKRGGRMLGGQKGNSSATSLIATADAINWSKQPPTVRINFIEHPAGGAASPSKKSKTKAAAIAQHKKSEAADGTNDDDAAWRKEHRITIHAGGNNFVSEQDLAATYGAAALRPMVQLSDLQRVHAKMFSSFSKLGFERPTPIQAQAWPLLFAGYDVIGIAKTGSGKTLAFAVPAVAHALAQTEPLQRCDGPFVLVLAPTRELALQIDVECRKLFTAMAMAAAADSNSTSSFRSLCIYGGTNRGPQLASLQASPTIVVATPGRLLDLLNTRTVHLRRVVYVALDECDRMLDEGFFPAIRSAFSFIREDRQTVLFSATWPPEIQRFAAEFTSKERTIRVQVGSDELQANADVRQHLLFLKHESDKLQRLQQLLERFPKNRVLIFVKKRIDADALEQKLTQGGFRGAYAFHGDKEQDERIDVLNKFRRSKTGGILVATDVAQRGLDIQELDVVINYDFPMTLEDYVHRIGRTGRAGATGDAFSFITKREEQLNAWVAQDLLVLLEEAKQDAPPELRRWAAESLGKPKPDFAAERAAMQARGPRLNYKSGKRPSSAAPGGGGAAASAFVGRSEKKKAFGGGGGGIFGKASFDPYS